MFDLIGEFIANGSKLNRNDVWALCGELNTLLWANNLLKKENKLQLVAEKLPAPVVLKDLEFSVINEVLLSLFITPFLEYFRLRRHV